MISVAFNVNILTTGWSVPPVATFIALLTCKAPPAMGTSQLLLTVLQLTPILAQLSNSHCITNEDEFNAEGWSYSATIEFAKTEWDLPLVFQGQMTPADGIFFVRGDGMDTFIEIFSPVPMNLRPPVKMYVRYYAHVPVPSGQGVVVTPDQDVSLRDLTLGTDFMWRNESLTINDVDANNNGIAIWFLDAQVGDFLLIDSLIITEGANLSEEEMVALCSPSTSPVPTSTSTTELSSSSSSVSITSTSPVPTSTFTAELSSSSSSVSITSTSPVPTSTFTAELSSSSSSMSITSTLTTPSSSTSSTSESSSASPVSQSTPSSTALSSTTESSSTVRSSESSAASMSTSTPTITQSTNAASTSRQSSSSTGPGQSSSSTPETSHSPSTVDSKSSSSVSSASTDGVFTTSEQSSSSQPSDGSTLTSKNSISSTTSNFYTSGTPDPDHPTTTVPTVSIPPDVYPSGSSGGLEDYELVLAVGVPFLFLLLLLIMLYYILTRRRRRRSAVSESELQLYNDASPSTKPSITFSNIDSADDSFQITNNNTDLKGLYLTRFSTDVRSRSPSSYRSSVDPVGQSYATDPSRLSLPSGDLLGADLVRRGSNISNLSRASARSTYSGIQEQGWAIPRLVRDN